jgi:hypothetical protein
MADGATSIVTSLKGKVSAEEWQARVDLAALYRLVALLWVGRPDLHPHFGADPGTGAPFPDQSRTGCSLSEMTASSLVKIDLDGNILQETPYFINPAGFTIHSAIHAARDDAKYRDAPAFRPGRRGGGAEATDCCRCRSTR